MTSVASHPGDSAAQRGAEVVMIDALEEQLGVPLAPRTIRLDDGTRVEIDGASPDLSFLVECSARLGPPRRGSARPTVPSPRRSLPTAPADGSGSGERLIVTERPPVGYDRRLRPLAIGLPM